jgi:hypothetical protein
MYSQKKWMSMLAVTIDEADGLKLTKDYLVDIFAFS